MKLLSMNLENFMCYASAEFNFFDITKIMAKNGKGKSSIATAYMWCLFNCDYELKDNPPVRREVNGKTVDDMDTAVTLTLDVDGKEVTMRKVQKRTYSKDGSSYKDDNKYFVNDVPKTLKDFNTYLGIDINAFKMCSNINAFLAKKPGEMREFLFSLTDSVTDLSIADSKDELSELAEQLKRYSAEELSAMYKTTKARVAKEIPILDGQIKEKERDIQIKSDTDLSALELARNQIKEQIEKNIKEQTDTETLIAESDTATDDLMNLKFKLSEIQNRANMEIEAQKADLSAKISEKQRKYDDARREAVSLSYTIKALESSIVGAEENRKKQAELWKQTRNMAFDEEKLVCSYCGQEYPEERKEQIRSDFEKKKETELGRITNTGLILKDQIEKEKSELENAKEKQREALDSEVKIFEEIKNLTAEKEALPAAVNVGNVAEYIAVQNQISEKEEELSKFSSVFEKRTELKARETGLREELSRIEKLIFASNTEQDEQRLAELKEKRINLEQTKTDAERILDLLDKLDKAKNEALSDSVNSHFGLVKWVLFEYAKNGNYKSVCVPTVDGKSILSTMSNKGNRMLGKLDICSSIQKISGISVPTFCDDIESLDAENERKIISMIESQLVLLRVSDDEEMKIAGVQR